MSCYLTSILTDISDMAQSCLVIWLVYEQTQSYGPQYPWLLIQTYFIQTEWIGRGNNAFFCDNALSWVVMKQSYGRQYPGLVFTLTLETLYQMGLRSADEECRFIGVYKKPSKRYHTHASMGKVTTQHYIGFS